MELMSTSFDKFYKYVYSVLDDVIPEEILGKITLATVKALNHLKENLKIIHRGGYDCFLWSRKEYGLTFGYFAGYFSSTLLHPTSSTLSAP